MPRDPDFLRAAEGPGGDETAGWPSAARLERFGAAGPAVAVALAVIALAGCGGATATPAPTPSPSPSPVSRAPAAAHPYTPAQRASIAGQIAKAKGARGTTRKAYVVRRAQVAARHYSDAQRLDIVRRLGQTRAAGGRTPYAVKAPYVASHHYTAAEVAAINRAILNGAK